MFLLLTEDGMQFSPCSFHLSAFNLRSHLLKETDENFEKPLQGHEGLAITDSNLLKFIRITCQQMPLEELQTLSNDFSDYWG